MANSFYGGVRYRNDCVNLDNVCNNCIHLSKYSNGFGYCYKKFIAKSSVTTCDDFLINIFDRSLFKLNDILNEYLDGNELTCDKGAIDCIKNAIDLNLEIGSVIEFANVKFRLFGAFLPGTYMDNTVYIYVAENNAVYTKEVK